MEKRFVFAIALSLLVLVLWSAMVSKTQPIVNKEVVTEKVVSSVVSLPSEPAVLPKENIPAASLFTFKQDKTDIIFVESQAAIKEVVFKAHQAYRFSLPYGFWLQDEKMVFKKEKVSADRATFVYSDKEKRITKDFIFSNTSYSIELEIEIQNLTSLPLNIDLPLMLGMLTFNKDQDKARFQDLTIATEEKTLHPNGRKSEIFKDIKFLGLRDRYFCAIVQPASGEYKGLVQKISPAESAVVLEGEEMTLAPNQKIMQKFSIYLGPQELKTINSINPDWSEVMYYGMFNFISHLIFQLLNVLFHLVHSWGWALVLLSVIIYFVLYPLTLKQMRSMKEMQILQPRIEELRKTYKGNPQRLNKEIMELYREHKVNPFGGCLPLILQMPIFFALYQLLMRSVVLKGAEFLWIKDLSEPDRLFLLPISLPILGNEFNILPLVMAIEMFVQQKLSMSSAAGSTGEQQKMMLILFPIMFGLIFYRMPSGLVLYWFINSSLMLAFQLRMSRTR